MCEYNYIAIVGVINFVTIKPQIKATAAHFRFLTSYYRDILFAQKWEHLMNLFKIKII